MSPLQAASQSDLAELGPPRAQGLAGGQRQTGICRLVRTQQSELYLGQQRPPVPTLLTVVIHLRSAGGGVAADGSAVVDVEVAAQATQFAVLLTSHLPDHVARSGGDHAADDRHAGLNNTGLLAGNGLQRAAQLTHVIVTDARDHCDQRLTDVRAVEPASQPHFQDRVVDLVLGEVQQRKRRRQLKERGSLAIAGSGLSLQVLDRRANAIDQIHQLGC